LLQAVGLGNGLLRRLRGGRRFGIGLRLRFALAATRQQGGCQQGRNDPPDNIFDLQHLLSPGIHYRV